MKFLKLKKLKIWQLKNSNCDKTQIEEKKLKDSNCDKTLKLKLWHNST